MLVQLLSTTALVLASFAQPAAAARPDGTSICDYYAGEKYGENNKDNQLKLMSSIVALAYAGGDNLEGADKNSTGIFKYGSYGNDVVFLRPFFDGSSKNQASGWIGYWRLTILFSEYVEFQ